MNESNNQQPAPMYQAPQNYAPPVGPQPKGKALGIASMVLGIIAAVCAFLPGINIISIPVVVVALVLGIVSLVQARGGQGPKGFGIAGIVCSAVALVVTIVMYVTIAAAVVAADYYADEYADVQTYADATSTDANITVQSVNWNEDDSGSIFQNIIVVLENNSAETIDYVQVDLPLYDESGVQVETAFGAASSVSPGVFQIEAISVNIESQLTFNEEELTITSW